MEHRHPGFYIRKEIDKRGWSQADLVWIIGCSYSSINLLVNEKKGVTATMSKKLGIALSLEPDFFYRLQSYHMLQNAKTQALN